MNRISFYGGETAGGVAKRNINQRRIGDEPVISQPQQDTISFRSNYYGDKKEKSSSVAGTLFMSAVITALAIGGLGYAHKTDVVSKLKDGKFKDFMKKSDKITEPCHKFCTKVKEFATKYYNKIKDFFNKKG